MEIALPMSDVIGRIQRRWLASFADAVEEWSALVSTLSRWEDDNLLDDPKPELLAEHKVALERFLAFGAFLSLATDRENFPDRRIADMVSATQTVLKDKVRMWHTPRLAKAESDRILATCFPDEP